MKKLSTALCMFAAIALLGGYFLIESQRVTSGNAYQPDGEMGQHLKQLTVSTNGKTIEFGNARLLQKNGHRILFLKGKPYEMGYQHGKLLKTAIKAGTVPVFADPVSSISKFRKLPGWIKKLILIYLEISIYAPIEKNTPQEYLDELKGIADGSGTDYRTIFIANFLSDLKMAMAEKQVSSAAKDIGFTTECTSFVASGPATKDRRLIFGRNTDYSNSQRWVRGQTVFFYEPKDGYRYVKISTAGLLKCNSAMNEKGMVIGGHFMGFKGADPAGVSFTIFENQIMRKTASVDDALRLLNDQPRGGAFGLMIADGKSGDAVAIEATRTSLGVRKMKHRPIALTNCAFTPELKKADILSNYNIAMRGILGRHERIMELIDEYYGRITPAIAAEFMGDHLDHVVRTERGTGSTLCFKRNVTSVIFQPQNGFFWVATGPEPTCTNPYRGFDFNAEFGNYPSGVQPGSLSGYRWKDESHFIGLQQYMKAIAAYTEAPDDIKTIRDHLNNAIEAVPDEALYARTLARILIHQQMYAETVELIGKALFFDQAPNEKAMLLLLSAQAFDLMGQRNEATRNYQHIIELWETHGSDPLTGINQMLYGLAVKHNATPFLKKDIDGFEIMDAGLE